MRIIVLLVTLMTAATVNASGKLSLQLNHWDSVQGHKPLMGLSVDEKLIGKLYVNSWTGFGSRPDFTDSDPGDKKWISGKIGLEYRFPGFSVGAGVFGNSAWRQIKDSTETGYFIKTSMKLW